MRGDHQEPPLLVQQGDEAEIKEAMLKRLRDLLVGVAAYTYTRATTCSV